MWRSLGKAGFLVALALVALSCSSDDESATTTTRAAGDTTSTTTGSGNEAVVIGTATTSVGEVLTDTDGLTLYILTDDGTGDPTCVDSCADTWPPVIAENIETHGELDISVNLVDGDAAERQVTINGRPVYTYSGDIEAGDANGQGFGGKWWVLDQDGNPIESTDTVVTTTTLAE